ncbi:MAG: Gmad2 immunoglobulin-like domain-containing protein [Candidatus Pacebacteria bacterium]|nr:Gmad2 immunoglobulin-like domain-containing protein [Candidatus Paceibacterota bacterium]
MKNKGILFILVVLVALVGFWAYNNLIVGKSNENPEVPKRQEEMKKEPESKKDFVPINKEIKEGDSIDVNYPSFGNEKIDSEIKNNIDSHLKEFKSSLTSDKTDQFLEISYSVENYSSDVVGVKYVYSYSGEVKPVSEVECFTYDLSNSKRVLLTDVFKNNSDYLNKLSALSYDYLMRSSTSDFVKTGTAPSIDNFSNFLLFGDRIVFYFSPCMVDACSEGIKQSSVKLSDVSSFLNERFSVSLKEEGAGLVLDNIKEGDLVKSPLEVIGKVNGDGWIGFEGRVGVIEILDDDNKVIASKEMMATSEWTKESIDFKVKVEFETPKTDSGFVVIYNENPSGLEANNRQKIMRVRFK